MRVTYEQDLSGEAITIERRSLERVWSEIHSEHQRFPNRHLAQSLRIIGLMLGNSVRTDQRAADGG